MAQSAVSAQPDLYRRTPVAHLLSEFERRQQDPEDLNADDSKAVSDNLETLLNWAFKQEPKRQSSGGTTCVSNDAAMKDGQDGPRHRTIHMPSSSSLPRPPPVPPCPSPQGKDNTFSRAHTPAPAAAFTAIPPPPSLPHPPRPAGCPPSTEPALHSEVTAPAQTMSCVPGESRHPASATGIGQHQRPEATRGECGNGSPQRNFRAKPTSAGVATPAGVPIGGIPEGQRRPLSVQVMRSPVPVLPEATYENPRRAVLKKVTPENQGTQGEEQPLVQTTTTAPTSNPSPSASRRPSVFDVTSGGMKLQGGWENSHQCFSLSTSQPQQMRASSGVYPVNLASKSE